MDEVDVAAERAASLERRGITPEPPRPVCAYEGCDRELPDLRWGGQRFCSPRCRHKDSKLRAKMR